MRWQKGVVEVAAAAAAVVVMLGPVYTTPPLARSGTNQLDPL